MVLTFKLADDVVSTLRNVLLARGFVEFIDHYHAPNSCNFQWKTMRYTDAEAKGAATAPASSSGGEASSAVHSRQKINHFQKTSGICQKDGLARSLRRMSKTWGALYNYSPETFILPREAPELRVAMESAAGAAKDAQQQPVVWICKPSSSSQGKNIFLITTMEQLTYETSFVVQRYIANPMLIGGYKYDLRIYVLVLSMRPLCVYMYREGLVRFSSQKYDPSDTSNLFSHLTNASINKHSPDLHAEKDVVGAGCKWNLARFFDYLERDRALNPLALWEQIKDIAILTILPIVAEVPVDGMNRPFELLGFDVMLSEEGPSGSGSLKPWIIEVNASPALAISSPEDTRVKIPLLNDLLDAVGFSEGETSRASAKAQQASSAGGTDNVNVIQTTNPNFDPRAQQNALVAARAHAIAQAAIAAGAGAGAGAGAQAAAGASTAATAAASSSSSSSSASTSAATRNGKAQPTATASRLAKLSATPATQVPAKRSGAGRVVGSRVATAPLVVPPLAAASIAGAGGLSVATAASSSSARSPPSPPHTRRAAHDKSDSLIPRMPSMSPTRSSPPQKRPHAAAAIATPSKLRAPQHIEVPAAVIAATAAAATAAPLASTNGRSKAVATASSGPNAQQPLKRRASSTGKMQPAASSSSTTAAAAASSSSATPATAAAAASPAVRRSVARRSSLGTTAKSKAPPTAPNASSAAAAPSSSSSFSAAANAPFSVYSLPPLFGDFELIFPFDPATCAASESISPAATSSARGGVAAKVGPSSSSTAATGAGVGAAASPLPLLLGNFTRTVMSSMKLRVRARERLDQQRQKSRAADPSLPLRQSFASTSDAPSPWTTQAIESAVNAAKAAARAERARLGIPEPEHHQQQQQQNGPSPAATTAAASAMMASAATAEEKQDEIKEEEQETEYEPDPEEQLPIEEAMEG